ncbi:MAG: ribonuclease PH [Alphaproteobacteria bacterium]|nr:ribonuclease PH [Alphaproteobacteria bacterium]
MNAFPPRPSGRADDALRAVFIETGVNKFAEGSCFLRIGDTQILCTATVEDKVPPFLRNTGRGWITAEYGMLPRATEIRIDREASRGKQTGRTHEIQRLIGRSLRSITDLNGFGERQVKVDCDVVQADGGTRTASITAGYIALHLAFQKMLERKVIKTIPLKDQIAAISCGIIGGRPVLDLDYQEDSQADVDANFVLTGNGSLVEVQSTAEHALFTEQTLLEMLSLARLGISILMDQQRKSLGFKS